MRFKNGSKVEVFFPGELPIGSWRCAEIMNGNGHNYTVKYVTGACDESIEGRVSRKVIRPCPPPPVGVAENWRPGDVVEIFARLSWKVATVVKVLARDCCWVRLAGSSNVFKVGKFDIRTRQSWLDGEWVVIGKDPRNHDNRKSNQQLKINCGKGFKASTPKMTKVKDDVIVGEENVNLQNSCIFSSRKLKRESPWSYPQAEAHGQKFGVPQGYRKRHRVSVDGLSQFPKKVKDNAFATDMIGKQEIHVNNMSVNFSDVDEESTKRNGVAGYLAPTSSEHYDANKATCSAHSISIGSNDPLDWPCRVLYAGEHAEDHSSDAESICWSYEKNSSIFIPNKEEMSAEIHRLELHAYRCTVEALHASGPLSWEKETLMTNLRISLHISNDEHLMEGPALRG